MKISSKDRRRYVDQEILYEPFVQTLELARAELRQQNGYPSIELSPGEVVMFYHYCNLTKGLGHRIVAGDFGVLVSEVRRVYYDTLEFFEKNGVNCELVEENGGVGCEKKKRVPDGMVKNMLCEIGYPDFFGS